MDDLLTMLRAANVALLSTAVLALVVFLTDSWADLSIGRRISMVSIRLLLIGGVIGSAIKYANAAPVDVSILIVSVSAVGVILGQWLARRDRPTPPTIGQAVLAVVEGVETNPNLPPCEHPGCIAARIELRQIAIGH